MDTLNAKCRYHCMCKYYREDAVTCGSNEEAKDYCGKYRQFSKLECTKYNEIHVLHL